MDFTIETDGMTGAMTYAPTDTVMNNIYLSLAVIRGSWWFNPDFGMRDIRRMKNTERAARLVKAYAEEALQWLLDTGRCTRIDVFVQQNRQQNLDRMKLLVEAEQADGQTVVFTTFREVV